MNSRTYELYDENEYFLKYLSIHPWLRYSTKPTDINKKLFQLQLLEKFNKEEITYDELKNRYEIIINVENNNKELISKLQLKHKRIEETCEELNNNNLHTLYKALMK